MIRGELFEVEVKTADVAMLRDFASPLEQTNGMLMSLHHTDDNEKRDKDEGLCKNVHNGKG